MRSFRCFALLLALAFPAMHAVLAQSSSSTPPTPANGQDQAQPQAPDQTPQQISVQARIRARREARRAAAIHDAYSHRFETYGGMGYLRFQPGPSLQRLTFYAWESGLTRNFGERLSINVEGRGYYGTAYVGLNPSNITRPSISQYDLLGGPSYRFYAQPKYSVSVRAMGGFAHANNSGDTNGFGAKTLGLYPDGNTFAISASALGEYNLTPSVALRLGSEYLITGFGSSVQNSVGFNTGIVYRFGKP
jgi:hypothetical protein